MKVLSQPKLKWILIICILAGLSFFSIYQYNTPLWREALKFYYTLQDHHRLKGIILSYGVYSPLAYILLQIVQVVVAPIPGGAIEFLGGVHIRSGGWLSLFHGRSSNRFIPCLRLGENF